MTTDRGPLNLQIDPAALLPLIDAAVRRAVEYLEQHKAQAAAKLTYTEEEAAALLGLEPHVLRDERRRGRIQASQIVGRRIRYMHSDLVNYLLGRRCER